MLLALSKNNEVHFKILGIIKQSSLFDKFLPGNDRRVGYFDKLKSLYSSGIVDLYTDNAGIHLSKDVIDFLQKTKFQVIFGVPYLP